MALWPFEVYGWQRFRHAVLYRTSHKVIHALAIACTPEMAKLQLPVGEYERYVRTSCWILGTKFIVGHDPVLPEKGPWEEIGWELGRIVRDQQAPAVDGKQKQTTQF